MECTMVVDLKIDRSVIVVDFISILPVYEWLTEDRQGRTVAVEIRTGFRMQSNVHESTRVVYPRSMYDSFKNTYDGGLSSWGTNERLTRISAAKPKNTYYRGFQEDTDVQSKELPLRPKISVVSTVRLYYATPVQKAGK